MSGRDVFINCPFTDDYRAHFEAIVFTVVRSGFTPRCARESDDGGEVRFDKICRIIRECPYSVHDISKTELDADSRLPRFNMPFELGLFLGAKRFGGQPHNRKKTLIFDRDRFRYQSYISDIAGQDIHPHNGDVSTHSSASLPLGCAMKPETQRFQELLQSPANLENSKSICQP
jgi:hypothetical protein